MVGFEVTLQKDTCENNNFITIFCGIIFGGIGIFLLFACVSYLFVGNEIIQIDFCDILSFSNNNHYVKNFCGILGAKAANVIMFWGVGAGAFVIILFFLFLYCKILKLHFVKNVNIIKTLVLCILTIIYISLVLYYIYKNFRHKIAIQNYIGYMTVSFGEIFEKYLGGISFPIIICASFLFLSLISERNIFIITFMWVLNFIKNVLKLLL